MFEVTTTTLASITAYIGDIFTDAVLLITLAIGIPLAFYVISKIIGLMPKK